MSRAGLWRHAVLLVPLSTDQMYQYSRACLSCKRFEFRAIPVLFVLENESRVPDKVQDVPSYEVLISAAISSREAGSRL